MTNFPKHICLIIEHNPHKGSYQSIEEYFEYYPFSERNLGFFKECCELQEIWTAQWYPETPSGFHWTCAPTFEKLMEKIND